MTYAEVVFAAKFGARKPNRVPRAQPGRIGLIAAWEDAATPDRFLAANPLAERTLAQRCGDARVRLRHGGLSSGRGPRGPRPCLPPRTAFVSFRPLASHGS